MILNKTCTIFSKDTRTQAVQPHTVNGHVLQHPTISLRRMNDETCMPPPRRRSSPNRVNEPESLQRDETNGNQNEPTEEHQSNGQPSDYVSFRKIII